MIEEDGAKGSSDDVATSWLDLHCGLIFFGWWFRCWIVECFKLYIGFFLRITMDSNWWWLARLSILDLKRKPLFNFTSFSGGFCRVQQRNGLHAPLTSGKQLQFIITVAMFPQFCNGLLVWFHWSRNPVDRLERKLKVGYQMNQLVKCIWFRRN